MGLVIALGGSVLFPHDSMQLNHTFVNALFQCCKQNMEKYRCFVIVTGGGSIARAYQQNVKPYTDSSTDLDILGIRATQLNALLISVVAQQYGTVQLLTPLISAPISSLTLDVSAQFIVCGGFQIGVSTDAIAAYFATVIGTTTLINISDTPYIYDKDPNMFSQATPYQYLNWTQYQSIIGNNWKPGTHLPFDPFAAQHAKEHGITVNFVAPQSEQIDAVLNEVSHQGTTIEGDSSA